MLENVAPDSVPPSEETKGMFTLSRKQWATGFRGIQIALCGPCHQAFRFNPEKLESTERGTRLIVDICKSCTIQASRLRFN